MAVQTVTLTLHIPVKASVKPAAGNKGARVSASFNGIRFDGIGGDVAAAQDNLHTRLQTAVAKLFSLT